MYRCVCFLLALIPVACASTPEAAPVHTQHTAARKAVAPSIPRRCAQGMAECLPPQRWVTRLCDNVYPDVALHMFNPSTPWQRFYMLARAEPFNASGGASLLGDKLERGEEVIALRHRTNTGEFQVGDSEGYDVLRWNGACATVHEGDFSPKAPKRVLHSNVEWRRLSMELREALEAQPEISAVYQARRKHCRGIGLGIVDKACEDDDKKLVEEIVHYVQNGGKLPMPGKLP
jgi:hypothetical protein